MINDLNRGFLSNKNATISTGSYGAYLVLTTWSSSGRNLSNLGFGSSNLFNLESGLGALLRLIMNSNNDERGMSPLYMHFTENSQQDQPPTINQPLPPIIEKNIKQEGDESPPQMIQPQSIFVNSNVVPYQPKLANI